MAASHKRSLDSESEIVGKSKRTKDDCVLADISESDQKILSNELESDVGITEYVNDIPGFYAVLKQRYSDFLVNEINIDGNVVRLTNFEEPVRQVNDYDVCKILEENIANGIQELSEGKTDHEVTIEVTDKDKDERKMIHEAIRNHFSGVESSTEQKDAKKFIVVKKQSFNVKGRRFLPISEGNHVHFVLYKENRDTMDAINTISTFLKLPAKLFSYAGTKDKRAKTSQIVSAYRIPVQKLLHINEKFNVIKVGNFVHKKDQIRLGNLFGNHFVIILRQLNVDDDLVKNAMSSLISKGFINYYGMQRFGTTSAATHSIGRFLILGEWKKAIDLILKPRTSGRDDDDLAECRKTWTETGDAKLSYEKLRYKSSIEANILKALKLKKNDLVNALNSIPRNTRLMYMHGYQSYIWNQIASKRIKTHGLKVLVGDVVPKSKNGNLDSSTEVLDDDAPKYSVKHITEDEIHKYAITDVLMPLPGHSITYPNNEAMTWYEELLKEDDMTLNSFECKVKTYSLSGAYRKLIVVPSNVQWDIISYDDVNTPLVLSDLDVMNGVVIDNSQGGSLRALKMAFDLPTSSYATMAIREVLKCDTRYNKDK